MTWDREHGCETAGKHGRAHHLGQPLTVERIRELPDRAEIVVTWSGGNGPWPYRVLVDAWGVRLVETIYCDPLLSHGPDQTVPLHRVTLGWDDESRAWADERVPYPQHIVDRMVWLREGTRD